MELRFSVSSEILEEPGVELTILGTEGEQLNRYAREASFDQIVHLMNCYLTEWSFN